MSAKASHVSILSLFRFSGRPARQARSALLLLAGGALVWWTSGRFVTPGHTKPFFLGLGDLPGGSVNSVASDISDDGLVVVGYSYIDFGVEAFRWTPRNGMAGLGILTGSIDSAATAVSADGLIVAGWSHSSSGPAAFRWTERSGIVRLSHQPGGEFDGECFGISADGSAIVGSAETSSGEEAFRWTNATGMVRLGLLSGRSCDSVASGASADGSVVVGPSSPARGCRLSLRTGAAIVCDLFLDRVGRVGVGRNFAPLLRQFVSNLFERGRA